MTKGRIMLAALAALVLLGALRHLQGVPDEVPVVVTTEAIPANGRLTVDRLEIRWVDRAAQETLAPRAVHRIADATDLVARMNIQAGEVVRLEPWLVFTDPVGDNPHQLSYHIPEGMRLINLRINVERAVAGRISPGDRVDIIFTARSQTQVESVTILRSIEALLVSQSSSGSRFFSTPSLDVGLLMTLEQAELLARSKQADGVLDLVLTPPVDLPDAPTPGPPPGVRPPQLGMANDPITNRG